MTLIELRELCTMTLILKIVLAIAIFYLDIKADSKDLNLIKLTLLMVDAIV